MNNRGPLTATGIYQIVARRGRQCGVTAYPHRFRHHFSHTWLDCGGAERDLMELNGWTSPQMLTRYGASARDARARRSYDRIMDNTPDLRPRRRPPTPARARRAAGPRGAARATQGRHARHGRGRPATQDITRQRTFIAQGRNYARRRQPREQGAARCPAPAPRPRPWPSRRINYHTVLNPRL